MQPSLKRKLLAGIAVASIAAFTGGAYAASRAINDNSRQAFINDVAKRLNVTPAQLSAALRGALEDRLQAAVKAGRLTQAQADAIKQHIAKFPGAPLGAFFGPHIRRFPGPLGFPGPQIKRFPGAPGFAGHGPRAAALQAAAQYLGLTEAQLIDQLASGKSLAQITHAKGKSTAELKTKMTAAVTATLDKLRQAGMITAAAEKQILSNLSARLDAKINATGGKLRFRFGVRPRAAGANGFAPPGYPGANGFAQPGPPPGYPGAATLPPGQVEPAASGPVY